MNDNVQIKILLLQTNNTCCTTNDYKKRKYAKQNRKVKIHSNTCSNNQNFLL